MQLGDGRVDPCTCKPVICGLSMAEPSISSIPRCNGQDCMHAGGCLPVGFPDVVDGCMMQCAITRVVATLTQYLQGCSEYMESASPAGAARTLRCLFHSMPALLDLAGSNSQSVSVDVQGRWCSPNPGHSCASRQAHSSPHHQPPQGCCCLRSPLPTRLLSVHLLS